jgi:hypothetical protein
MGYRAIQVADNPLDYFLQHHDGRSLLQVSDVLLRANKDPKEVFARLIRAGTSSKWSHSAIFYLISDPYKGFNNTFLVEAKTKGINIASWRNEVVPFDQFTVGIKRPRLDWYVENADERSDHRKSNLEDTHAISYLRHVRGIAMDQINGLYDQKTVYELVALYARRAARKRLSSIPQVADAAGAVADFFKKWDASDSDATQVLRFICSGIVQYSFFEALRRRIMNDWDISAHREAAESNLQNMHRVIFREDPEQIIPNYIRQVQNGTLDIHRPAPEDVLDLLKMAVPSDFNDSANLEWRYVIFNGNVWQIEEMAEDYHAQSEEEAAALVLTKQEFGSPDE